MMYGYELKEILEDFEELTGDVYYKDNDGELHIIDFADVEPDGTLVLSENTN